MIEPVTIIGLIIGIGVGYLMAKALKVAAVIGLIILLLAFLGITVVSRSQIEEFLRAILPAIEWIKAFIESSQLFAIGILIGFAVGLLK
ncbi:MAG: hypothetical protein FGF52_02550 [Candidatus Brockarchaeota archaeon]|nr:hypothetical protein [Candidatus Brockarchaeota archaeon]